MSADEQQSLLTPAAVAPEAVVEFLAGFIATYVFGEKRTAGQERLARAASREYADRIASLREEHRPCS